MEKTEQLKLTQKKHEQLLNLKLMEKQLQSEGSQIEFVTESGENVVGQVLKITGKGEKTKLQIMPIGADCEQIWKVVNIKTLKVIEV